MEINVLKSSKDEIELELDSVTIAEILRVYLNKDSAVTFAAWKREHPTKKPSLIIKTKGKAAKKAEELARKQEEERLAALIEEERLQR